MFVCVNELNNAILFVITPFHIYITGHGDDWLNVDVDILLIFTGDTFDGKRAAPMTYPLNLFDSFIWSPGMGRFDNKNFLRVLSLSRHLPCAECG